MEQLSLMLKVLWDPAGATSNAAAKPIVILPLLALFLGSLLTTAVTFHVLNPGDMAVRSVEHAGVTLTPAQQQQVFDAANSPGPLALGFLSAALRPLTIILLVSLLYFTIFSLIGRAAGFKAFLSVTALAFAPFIFMYAISIAGVLWLPKASIIPEEIGAVSPALFLDGGMMSRPAFIAVTLIDGITIWILILLTIGYRALASRKVSSAARIAAVVAPWLIYCGLRIGFAVMTGF